MVNVLVLSYHDRSLIKFTYTFSIYRKSLELLERLQYSQREKNIETTFKVFSRNYGHICKVLKLMYNYPTSR
jgi:hypothetical protein